MVDTVQCLFQLFNNKGIKLIQSTKVHHNVFNIKCTKGVRFFFKFQNFTLLTNTTGRYTILNYSATIIVEQSPVAVTQGMRHKVTIRNRTNR